MGRAQGRKSPALVAGRPHVPGCTQRQRRASLNTQVFIKSFLTQKFPVS